MSPSSEQYAAKVYIDRNDWWIGAYRGPHHWYLCLLPCVVIRWRRRGAFGFGTVWDEHPEFGEAFKDAKKPRRSGA